MATRRKMVLPLLLLDYCGDLDILGRDTELLIKRGNQTRM
jgi:hypothetical protein